MRVAIEKQPLLTPEAPLLVEKRAADLEFPDVMEDAGVPREGTLLDGQSELRGYGLGQLRDPLAVRGGDPIVRGEVLDRGPHRWREAG